jgi:hypothetical protein
MAGAVPATAFAASVPSDARIVPEVIRDGVPHCGDPRFEREADARGSLLPLHGIL